jgi:hypothetical protein
LNGSAGWESAGRSEPGSEPLPRHFLERAHA